MMKRLNAFGLRHCVDGAILKNPFFNAFRQAWQGVADKRADKEILQYFSIDYTDELYLKQIKLDGLDELLEYVTKYLQHIKRHVGRLTNYTNAVANKIAADETGDVADLRERHKRSIYNSRRYKLCINAVDALKKKISEQYQSVDEEVKHCYRAIFGKRLRQARLAAGLTQAQLGESLRLSQKTISGYEKGLREPNLAQLARFAYKLNRPVGWFLDAETPFGR